MMIRLRQRWPIAMEMDIQPRPLQVSLSLPRKPPPQTLLVTRLITLYTDSGDSSTNSSPSGFNLLSPAVKYTIYGIAAAVALAVFAFLFWCCRRRRRARRAVREAAIPPKYDFGRYESPPYPGPGDSPLEYGIVGTKGGQTVYWKWGCVLRSVFVYSLISGCHNTWTLWSYPPIWFDRDHICVCRKSHLKIYLTPFPRPPCNGC